MKEEKDAKKSTGTEAEKKINTSAFMRQIAVAGINEEKHTAVHTDNQADEQAIESETKARESAKKKKHTVTEHEGTFITRNELQNRQGLYIDKENYDTLQSLINVIRRKSKLSISGLVDNIIRHHIDLYEEDINRIFDENIRKPITKK